MKDIKVFLRRKRREQQYSCEQYKNLPERKTQKLVQYRKKIIKREKMPYHNYKKSLSIGFFFQTKVRIFSQGRTKNE